MGKMVVTSNKATQNFEKAIAELAVLQTRVGWFETAKYPDGTSVAYVASIQENGVASQSIPPRPFFAPTQAHQSHAWGELMGRFSKRIIAGQMTAFQAMDALGEQAASDVFATISQITEPPLSIITLLARKHRQQGGGVTGKTIGEFAAQEKSGQYDISGVSTKPLNDTGLMMATLTHTVEKK